MSDLITPTDVPKPTPPAQAPEDGQQPEPKVDETDWKAKARDWEKRAKDNKGAADRLAELEEANKTEVQKSADRLAAAEKAAIDARAEATRYKIASEFKLSPEDAAALEFVSSEDGMRLVAERLGVRDVERKKQGNFVPKEGNTPSATDNSELETVRSLFGG